MNIKHTLAILPLFALAAPAVPAWAGQAPEPAEAAKEARIPFADIDGIRDWRSADSRTLYIQDRHRHWYKATLMTPAFDLQFAQTIGFDPGPVGTFDKFSSIVVRGQRYAVASLVKLEGPPPRKPGKKDA